MSHTNETNYLGLPQFIDDDKASWLGDVNEAYRRIDANASSTHANLEGAVTNANSALSLANQAISTANNANNSATDAHTEAVLAESIANNALNVANNTATLATALQTAQGDLADLDTIDKTSLVNAINNIATLATALQTAQGDLADLDTIDKTSLVNAINEVASSPATSNRVLWENSDLTSFAPQDITLDDSVLNYTEIEIVCSANTSTGVEEDRAYVSVRQTSPYATAYVTRIYLEEADIRQYERLFTCTNQNTITVDNCHRRSKTYGQTGNVSITTDNTQLIPIAVIGHSYIGD